MRRREFITLLGGAAAAWPLATRAQQTNGVRRVGVLMNSAATETVPQSYLTAFIQGLRQLGWTEGQNLRIDVRWNARRSPIGLLRTREGIAYPLVPADERAKRFALGEGRAASPSFSPAGSGGLRPPFLRRALLAAHHGLFSSDQGTGFFRSVCAATPRKVR
jgi:hypothetical protein